MSNDEQQPPRGSQAPQPSSGWPESAPPGGFPQGFSQQPPQIYPAPGPQGFSQQPQQGYPAPGPQGFPPQTSQAYPAPGPQGFPPPQAYPVPGPQGFSPSQGYPAPGPQGFPPQTPQQAYPASGVQGFPPSQQAYPVPGPQGFSSQPAHGSQGFSPQPPQVYPAPGPQGFSPSQQQGYAAAGPQGFSPAQQQGGGPYSPPGKAWGTPGRGDSLDPSLGGSHWSDDMPTQYDPNLTMNTDMSLGYSQTMGFRAISLPHEPERQSMPNSHQARLQKLREERMRKQQRNGQPDVTELLRQRKQGRSRRGRSDGGLGMPPGARGESGRSPSGQISYAGVPAMPAQSAAATAQDTGMVQRVVIARASFLITGSLIASNILGLLQTFLFTYVFGTSSLGDAYRLAYLIPNLIYTVVTGGALSSAFIPVFTSYAIGKKDEKTAWHIANSALNLASVVMIVLAGIAALLAPVLVPLYNAKVSPQEMSLIITLTRIMLLQAVVLGSGVIVSSVLNTRQDFTHTAIGTVLYNVGLILGLIPGCLMASHSGAHNPLDAAVYSATWGVVLAAILQVGAQIPGLSKVGMRYRFVLDWRHPGVRRIATQMIPRVLNSVMLSFSTTVDSFWLTFLEAVPPIQSGLVTEYFQAFSILLMPVSIFGSAVSTAAFPTLAGYVTRGRFDRVRSIFLETLRGILFLTIPSCVGLMALSFPIVQVLLHFDLRGAQNTALVLFWFAPGLPALAAVEILTRSFYALQDSRTPVIISVSQFVLKIALSIGLIHLDSFGPQWGLGGLAISTSIASLLEALVLFILLYRRIGGIDLRALGGFLGRIFLATGAMAVALILLRLVLDQIINTNAMPLALSGVIGAVSKLLIELGVGAAVFLIVARCQNMEEMNTGLVRRVINMLRLPWL